jgi:8-oxo-dGTP diphosphatase
MTKHTFKDYPRPSLAVDPAVMTVHNGRLWTVLWRRQYPPDEDSWALPGVFVNQGEELESAVSRALKQKANLAEVSHLEQLFTWNKIDRDPRGWVVTVAYFALTPSEQLRAAVQGKIHVGLFALEIESHADSGRARIFGPDDCLIRPAFDHADILGSVVLRLREKLWHSPVALALLPDKFTLREMKLTYEAILGQKLNKDSFRRTVVKTRGIIRPTGEYQEAVDHRPAELFTRGFEK